MCFVPYQSKIFISPSVIKLFISFLLPAGNAIETRGFPKKNIKHDIKILLFKFHCYGVSFTFEKYINEKNETYFHFRYLGLRSFNERISNCC